MLPRDVRVRLGKNLPCAVAAAQMDVTHGSGIEGALAKGDSHHRVRVYPVAGGVPANQPLDGRRLLLGRRLRFLGETCGGCGGEEEGGEQFGNEFQKVWYRGLKLMVAPGAEEGGTLPTGFVSPHEWLTLAPSASACRVFPSSAPGTTVARGQVGGGDGLTSSLG